MQQTIVLDLPQKTKQKKKYCPFNSFSYGKAKWTQSLEFKEFRALSPYEVCHSCLSMNDVAIHAFMISFVAHDCFCIFLGGVPVKQCLVIISFAYTTRTSLFLIRDPLSVFCRERLRERLAVRCDIVYSIHMASAWFAYCPLLSSRVQACF